MRPALEAFLYPNAWNMDVTPTELLWVVGGLLVAVTAWDAFVTVLSLKGAGPLTSLWTRQVWNGLLWIHDRRPIHALLSLVGPLMLLGTIVVWYLLLGLASYLVFAGSPHSVINNSTGASADFVQKVYFVGSTISSLGYGDLVPNGMPWTLLSSVAAFAGTVVLTLSLSYVLSVLSAAIERRTLAQSVFGVGSQLTSFIKNARLHDARESLQTHVLQIASQLDHHVYKHLSYPILHYFHTPRPDTSPARVVLLLSDAFFLLGAVAPEGKRPSPGLCQVVDGSIRSFIEHGTLPVPDNLGASSQAAAVLRTVARELQFDELDESSFGKAWRGYQARRHHLHEACRQDGWRPE